MSRLVLSEGWYIGHLLEFQSRVTTRAVLDCDPGDDVFKASLLELQMSNVRLEAMLYGPIVDRKAIEHVVQLKVQVVSQSPAMRKQPFVIANSFASQATRRPLEKTFARKADA